MSELPLYPCSCSRGAFRPLQTMYMHLVPTYTAHSTHTHTHTDIPLRPDRRPCGGHTRSPPLQHSSTPPRHVIDGYQGRLPRASLVQSGARHGAVQPHREADQPRTMEPQLRFTATQLRRAMWSMATKAASRAPLQSRAVHVTARCSPIATGPPTCKRCACSLYLHVLPTPHTHTHTHTPTSPHEGSPRSSGAALPP